MTFLHRWRDPLILPVLGGIAALGLAPFDLWPLTYLALALAMPVVAQGATLRRVFGRAFLLGLGWFALALVWIVQPFLVEPEIYGWMAPFALILMAAGGALFWAIPGALAWAVSAPWARTITIAAALILSDWLRGWIFTGFPWAQVGQVLIGTPLMQAAAVIGATGLSALVLIPAALAGVGRGRGAALALATVAALWAAGLARQAAPLPPDQTQIVRLVQPDAAQHLKWDPNWAPVFYQRLLDLSAAPAARRPDVVIWPESAVNFLLDDPYAGPALAQMAASAQGAPLMTGIQRSEGGRYYNSIALLTPEGAVASVYDKFHLVPFGEYIPWGDAMARFGIRAFAAQEGFGYAPGPGPAAMAVPGFPEVQPLICYEAIFGQHLRVLPTRPGWLVQVTNDGWFGTFSGPYQHFAQARLRAVQSGLPMMRVANTGISAVIDARGGVRDTLPLGAVGFIDAPLPGALPETPWTRWGELPALAFTLLVLAAGRRHRFFS